MAQTPVTDISNPTWWQADPQESYRQLLDYDGLWRDERSGIYLAARHGDVLAAERDAATFASRLDEIGVRAAGGDDGLFPGGSGVGRARRE